MRESADPAAIGNRIRLAREEIGFSRESLSELADITPYYLGQIERGERNMSVKTLIKISSGLKVSLDYLVYGKKGE